MKLGPIIDRLKSQGFKRVYGALELANLQKSPVRLPAHFVFPQGWDGSPSRTNSIVHDQKFAQTFGVATLLEGRPLMEDRASDELDEIEGKLIAALAGWTHPEAWTPFDAHSGRLLSVSGTTFGWITTFRTETHSRSTLA